MVAEESLVKREAVLKADAVDMIAVETFAKKPAGPHAIGDASGKLYPTIEEIELLQKAVEKALGKKGSALRCSRGLSCLQQPRARRHRLSLWRRLGRARCLSTAGARFHFGSSCPPYQTWEERNPALWQGTGVETVCVYYYVCAHGWLVSLHTRLCFCAFHINCASRTARRWSSVA